MEYIKYIKASPEQKLPNFVYPGCLAYEDEELLAKRKIQRKKNSKTLFDREQHMQKINKERIMSETIMVPEE